MNNEKILKTNVMDFFKHLFTLIDVKHINLDNSFTANDNSRYLALNPDSIPAYNNLGSVAILHYIFYTTVNSHNSDIGTSLAFPTDTDTYYIYISPYGRTGFAVKHLDKLYDSDLENIINMMEVHHHDGYNYYLSMIEDFTGHPAINNLTWFNTQANTIDMAVNNNVSRYIIQ